MQKIHMKNIQNKVTQKRKNSVESSFFGNMPISIKLRPVPDETCDQINFIFGATGDK